MMGLLKFGALIRFIPHTIVTGFTAGIAVTIVIGQLKDFFGLTFQHSPIETVEKLQECISTFGTLNVTALLIGILALAIQIIWPKFNAKIPVSLIAVIVTAAVVKMAGLDVNTIGSLYDISNKLPVPHLPVFDIGLVKNVLPDAFTIAILAAIESLLSCVVADGMIGDKHNPNVELVAQGAGNIASGIFGGIPATGAIARTAANIKNGGRSPIAGMVHAVVLVLILVVLMPYAALIPMPTIAAILFIVAYNMCGWREFVDLVKTSPKSDIAVLIITFALTVVFDLVVAIEFGLVLAAVLFLKRMADVAEVRSWTYVEEEQEGLRVVPKGTLVYEIEGPMFFAVADQFLNVYGQRHKSCNYAYAICAGDGCISASQTSRSVQNVRKTSCDFIVFACYRATAENDGESRICKGSWRREVLRKYRHSDEKSGKDMWIIWMIEITCRENK